MDEFDKPKAEVPDADASKEESVDGSLPPSTLRVVHTGGGTSTHPPRKNHQNVMGRYSIAFYIGDLDVPLVIQVTNRIVLGRYSQSSKEYPSVDLTQYNGYELGVSRLHAVIYRLGKNLMFEDLNASNGSHINETRIAAHAPYILQQGDVIKLGKLMLETYFGVPDNPEKP